jgi:hypothetical protein
VSFSKLALASDEVRYAGSSSASKSTLHDPIRRSEIAPSIEAEAAQVGHLLL